MLFTKDMDFSFLLSHSCNIRQPPASKPLGELAGGASKGVLFCLAKSPGD